MQDNEITTISFIVEFNNTQLAHASFELSADEQFESMFASQVIPTNPITLYIVTRNKAGGPQIVNTVEILRA